MVSVAPTGLLLARVGISQDCVLASGLGLHPGLSSVAPYGSSCRFAASGSAVLTQTLKPGLILLTLAARMKLCPCYKASEFVCMRVFPQPVKDAVPFPQVLRRWGADYRHSIDVVGGYRRGEVPWFPTLATKGESQGWGTEELPERPAGAEYRGERMKFRQLCADWPCCEVSVVSSSVQNGA